MSEPTKATDLLDRLRHKIDQFSQERDWGKFHSPKNLSMAMSIEAAELMEIFQWQDGSEDYATLSAEKKTAVEHEIADVFIYLMRFCSVTGIDPLAAAEEKLELNASKYPSALVRGKSMKYTEY